MAIDNDCEDEPEALTSAEISKIAETEGAQAAELLLP